MERPKQLCIDPLVNKAHTILADGGSFRGALTEVKRIGEKTEHFVRNIDPDRQILHTLAFSTLGLLAITSYEYLKSHGVNFLPDITTIVPAACISTNVKTWNIGNDGKFHEGGKDQEKSKITDRRTDWR